MSFVDMKNSYDCDYTKEKEDILRDILPFRSFYNLKKLEDSNENIIKEINHDFTYNDFRKIMEDFSIVAIGPMVYDHDVIPQITFISDNHDCSFHNNGNFHYPPIVFQLQNKDVVLESTPEPPLYYYSGVFVFRGIQVDLLCHYISNYLLDDCHQYHDESDVFKMIVDNSFMDYTIEDRISSRLMYSSEQMTLRENIILHRMLDAMIGGDEHQQCSPVRGELLEIFKIAKKYENDRIEDDEDDSVFIISLMEWLKTFIRHKIWRSMITDDMEEDYGFVNFAIKYIDFGYLKVSGQVCIFNINKTKILMDFEKDEIDLTIKLFIPSNDDAMDFPKLICTERFDVLCDKPIIQLTPKKIEKKLRDYCDTGKFFAFMTKFFGMIDDTQSMIYFGQEIPKKTGKRRDRASTDDREDDCEIKDRFPEKQEGLPVSQD